MLATKNSRYALRYPISSLGQLFQLFWILLPTTPTLLRNNSRRRSRKTYSGDFEDRGDDIRGAEFVGWFFDHDGGFEG